MGFVLPCRYLAPIVGPVFEGTQGVTLIINYNSLINWVPNFVVAP